MGVGSGSGADNTVPLAGRIRWFTAADDTLTTWADSGVFFEVNATAGGYVDAAKGVVWNRSWHRPLDQIECPDVFELGDHLVVLASLQYDGPWQGACVRARARARARARMVAACSCVRTRASRYALLGRGWRATSATFGLFAHPPAHILCVLSFTCVVLRCVALRADGWAGWLVYTLGTSTTWWLGNVSDDGVRFQPAEGSLGLCDYGACEIRELQNPVLPGICSRTRVGVLRPPPPPSTCLSSVTPR